MDMLSLAKYLPETCLAVPPLGSDIVQLASHFDLPLEDLLWQLLTFGQIPPIPLTVSPGQRKSFKWVAGHAFDSREEQDIGPKREYAAFIVAKQLWPGSYQLAGLAGKFLRQAVASVGLKTPQQVYATSLLKTQALIPGKFQAKWLAQQASFVWMEIAMARPKYILALGAEVSKFFLGKKFKMGSQEGRWHTLHIDLRSSIEEERTPENQHEVFVLPCSDPSGLVREQKPEQLDSLLAVTTEFISEVNRYNIEGKTGLILDNNVSGTQVISGPAASQRINYPVIRTIPQLAALLARIETEVNSHKLIGVDAEWQGRHPQNAGSYLRCVQLGWNYGRAAVLHITDKQGRWGMEHEGRSDLSTHKLAMQMIRDMFDRNKFRVAGFYFQSDHEWLSYYGLDLLDFYEAADSPQLAEKEGGFGVELAVNVYDELMRNNLEVVRRRFTTVHDYYYPFEKYRQLAIEEGRKQARGEDDEEEIKEMHEVGFGWIPDEDLFPYAGGDADVTVSAALKFCELLHSDRFGNNVWGPFWLAQRAAPCCCEIMRVGLPVSLRRCLELSVMYDEKMQELKKQLELHFNWPNFPIDTWQQLGDALYGSRYAGYRDSVTGRRVSRRPVHSRTLNLEPVISNEENPVEWAVVRQSGDDEIRTPATGLKAIGMLRYSNEVLARRRNSEGEFAVVRMPPPKELTLISSAKMLRQVQKNFLGVPYVHTSTGEVTFGGGYPDLVCDDGYLRCFISMTKETGRWSASNPNLHNSPNKQEGEYSKILGDKYLGYVRTMFEAPPGYLIVESDYASAELFMLAMASGDTVLWDHCSRNLLEESDPRFVDPHANLCVNAFKLQCAPNKAGLKLLKKTHMRNVAKCVAGSEYVWTDYGPYSAEALMAGSQDEVRQFTGSENYNYRVMGLDSHLPLVAGVYTGKQECYRVATHLGYSITATAEHRHVVIDRIGKLVEKPVEEIEVGDQLLLQMQCSGRLNDHGLSEDVYQLIDDILSEKAIRRDTDEMWPDAIFCLAFLTSADLQTTLSGQTHTTVKLTLRTPSTAASCYLFATLDRLRKLSVNFALLADGSIQLRGSNEAIASLQLLREIFGPGSETVLAWSNAHRMAYIGGVLVSLCTGIRHGVSVRVPTESAYRFQLLLQTLGYLTRVREVEGVAWVTPFCTASLQLYQDAKNIKSASFARPAPTAVAEVTYSRLVQVVLTMCKKYNIVLPDGTKLDSRDELLRAILRIPTEKYSRDEEDWQQLNSLMRVLESELVPVVVTAVTPVGLLDTYDFETTNAHNHWMTINGVITHNSCIYGWAYGRGAAAIVLGARETGVDISQREAENLLRSLEDTYPLAARYLEEASMRVDDGFLVTPLGRIRRFPKSTDRKTLAGYRREAKNAPIQGGVADIVNRAAYNLRAERRLRSMRYHIMLQMHDAFFFLCPIDEVVTLCNEVIPKAMCTDVPIIPYRLDGTLAPGQKPMYMGNNVSVAFAWKEAMPKEEKVSRLLELGINPEHIQRLEID